jgi:hypothetical protein
VIDLVWLRRGSAGRSSKRPPDGDLYTEWASHQIVLPIARTRWTHGGALGLGWKPLRIWLRVDNDVRRSKYL